MKAKLLKRLRQDAEFSIYLIKDISTSEYLIKEKIVELGGIYSKNIYKTKDWKKAKKLLQQAKREYILKNAGIKIIKL